MSACAAAPLEPLDFSQLNVLRSLQVGNWITPFCDADAIVHLFSTLASPVLSELVILSWYDQFIRFLSDATSLETLRMMSTIRPFKLVILFSALHPPSREATQALDSTLGSAIAKGTFDFLDSPPVIRFERFTKTDGGPVQEWMSPRPDYPY